VPWVLLSDGTWVYLNLSSEISASSIIIGFWNDQITPAAWISIIVLIVVVINIYSVRIYGESEFWFVSIKIIAIIGLLILALVLDIGGGPSQDRLGFRYWKDPGAMKEYMATEELGRFLGLFSTFINAAFSYSGVETVAVAAGETENPR
jgi:amino acid transporter